MLRRGLLALLVVSVLLSGCSLRPTAPAEPVTIQFAVEEGDRQEYEQFLAVFKEKAPEITVELQADRNQDTDCFVDLPFDLANDVEAGRLLALDPFLEQDSEFTTGDFYPGAVELFQAQGKTWGIPAGVDPIVLYYNKNLFDAAGIPYPQPGWTWNDFLTAGLAMSKPDERVFGYSMPQSADAFDAALFVYQHGGRLFDDINGPTATTFDDPKTIEAVEWYTDLALRHNIAPTPEQMRSFYGGGAQGLGRGIYEGKFGMWLGFFSERGGRTWPVEWVEPWGVAPLPRDESAATAGTAPGYFLVAGQPAPEACWTWVTFLSEQTPEGLAPARRALMESVQFREQVGEETAVAVRDAVQNAILISPEAAQAAPALSLFGNAVRQVLAGAMTPEEAMLAAQDQAETALP